MCEIIPKWERKEPNNFYDSYDTSTNTKSHQTPNIADPGKAEMEKVLRRGMSCTYKGSIHRSRLNHDVLLCKWFLDVDINFEDILLGVLQNQSLELSQFPPAPVVDFQSLIVTNGPPDQGTEARVDLLYGQPGLVFTGPAQLLYYQTEVRGPEVR